MDEFKDTKPLSSNPFAGGVFLVGGMAENRLV